MNILILSPSNEGTIAKCSASLYDAFHKSSGISVKIICLYKYAGGEAILKDSEFLIDRTTNESSSCSLWKKVKWVRALKKKYHPDMTVSTLTATSILNVFSGGDDKKIGVFHAPIAQSKAFGKLYYLMTLLTYYLVFPFLDKCFCVSQESKQDLETIITINKKRIDVVYNTHNVERINELAKEPLTTDYSAIFNKPVALYCGRLDENKAPSRAIDALRDARNKNLQLVIIGPDSSNMWPTIYDSLDEDLKARVKYLGCQKNPYQFMSRSKMLISCSYSEGLPGVIIEALALKVAVISTNSSQGVWEIFCSHSHYDAELSTMSVFNDGIITSNLSFINKEQYKTDIHNLTSAIDYLLTHKLPMQFKFAEEICRENIVKKYLQC